MSFHYFHGMTCLNNIQGLFESSLLGLLWVSVVFLYDPMYEKEMFN